MKNKVNITIPLDVEVKEKIKAAAEIEMRSISNFITVAALAMASSVLEREEVKDA